MGVDNKGDRVAGSGSRPQADGMRDRMRASRLQWGLFRTIIRALVALYRLTGGAAGKRWMGGNVLLLTTRGRRSGRQHTLPVTYATDGDSLLVAASGGTETRLPTWLLNLRQSPEAQVQVGRRKLMVRAVEATGEHRDRCWERLVQAYPPFADYPQTRRYAIPVVVLVPADANQPAAVSPG